MHQAKAPGRVSVAILGAGLIGLDLAEKIQRSAALDCRLVVGRDQQALGLRRAAELGCETSAGGITALLEAGPFDIVCDASNADAHPEHWSLLRDTGALLIDLTPSSLGTMVVPTVNGAAALPDRNISLVTCGGQAAIPILHALAQDCVPSYVEVVCSGASASAGRATRLNLDHYIETTQAAVRAFTGAQEVKVMLNLSPADPPPPFRVTMTMLPIRPGAGMAAEAVGPMVEAAAQDVRAFAPGFAVTSCQAADDQIRVAVEVTAEGGRIPRYAGNLDIINAAAVLLAERYAARADAAALHAAGLGGGKDTSWTTR
jgi:acetaldehyde dehydrogenase